MAQASALPQKWRTFRPTPRPTSRRSASAVFTCSKAPDASLLRMRQTIPRNECSSFPAYRPHNQEENRGREDLAQRQRVEGRQAHEYAGARTRKYCEWGVGGADPEGNWVESKGLHHEEPGDARAFASIGNIGTQEAERWTTSND